MSDNAPQAERKSAISEAELIALMAMLTATVAFSIDAMLPALPAISTELIASDPNQAQLVIGAFILGMGVGTFFAGPLSDAYGRKTIAMIGAVIYTLAALAAAFAPSLEMLIVARCIQGIGASGPRVAALTIVRDLYSGRRMAQILSYVIFVFTLAPVIAPSVGWLITEFFGWRAIFLAFAVFAVVSMAWLGLRQGETLTAENTRPFRFYSLLSGARTVLTNRRVLAAGAAQTLVFSCLFSALLSCQQIFEEVFDRATEFPLWFGLMGILAASSNLINARVVMRLGMITVVRRALMVQGSFSAVFLLGQIGGFIPVTLFFPVTFLWLTSIFFLAGFSMGNMNALALEPLGKMAGMGASIVTSAGTIGAAVISAPIGLAFDGTMRPLTAGILIMVILALLFMRGVQDTAPSQ